MGELPNLTVKQMYLKACEKTLLSITKVFDSQEKGLDALSIVLEYDCPFMLIESALRQLNAVTKDVENTKKLQSINQIALDSKNKLERINLSTYDNLRALVYQLLAVQTVIVVGSYEERLKLFTTIGDFLPVKLLLRIQFTTYSGSNISESDIVDLIGCDATDGNYQTIDQMVTEKKSLVIVDIPSKEIFGQDSTPFTESIEGLINDNKRKAVRKSVERFYNKAIESDEIIDPKIFAKQENIPYGDSFLMLNLRASHYNKERPHDVMGG